MYQHKKNNFRAKIKGVKSKIQKIEKVQVKLSFQLSISEQKVRGVKSKNQKNQKIR